MFVTKLVFNAAVIPGHANDFKHIFVYTGPYFAMTGNSGFSRFIMLVAIKDTVNK
jgi:hypothetical protein